MAISVKAFETRLKNLWKLLPPIPSGPPVPKKEIVVLLKALRAQIDRLIEIFEREAPRAKGSKAGARKAPRRRKAAKAAKVAKAAPAPAATT